MSLAGGGGRRVRAAEESVSGFRPYPQAFGIIGRALAELLAPKLTLAERVAPGLDHGRRGRCRDIVLARHLDDHRRDGNGDEYDGAEPGQHLAIHDRVLSCR